MGRAICRSIQVGLWIFNGTYWFSIGHPVVAFCCYMVAAAYVFMREAR